MFILPEFDLKIQVDGASNYGDIESIRLNLVPVPIDYRVSVCRASAMYQYFIYPTKFGGVESREATKKGIVWLTAEEIDLLNEFEEDDHEFFNEFIQYIMEFRPFEVEDRVEDDE